MVPVACVGDLVSAPEFTTSEALKKRQLGIFIGVAVIVCGALLLFLYNNAKRQAIPPHQVVDPEDAWITSSEVDLGAMADRLKAFERENELLRNRLDRLETPGTRAPTAVEDANPSERSASGLLPPLDKPPPPVKSIPKPPSDVPPSSGDTGLTGLQAPPPKITRVAFAKVNDRQDALVHPHINETLPAGTFVNALAICRIAFRTGYAPAASLPPATANSRTNGPTFASSD